MRRRRGRIGTSAASRGRRGRHAVFLYLNWQSEESSRRVLTARRWFQWLWGTKSDCMGACTMTSSLSSACGEWKASFSLKFINYNWWLVRTVCGAILGEWCKRVNIRYRLKVIKVTSWMESFGEFVPYCFIFFLSLRFSFYYFSGSVFCHR